MEEYPFGKNVPVGIFIKNRVDDKYEWSNSAVIIQSYSNFFIGVDYCLPSGSIFLCARSSSCSSTTPSTRFFILGERRL